MRRACATLFIGLGLIVSARVAGATELRVLSLGSVQISAKSLAQDFTKATGHQVALTIVAPSEIGQKLAGGSYDMIICSVPAICSPPGLFSSDCDSSPCCCCLRRWLAMPPLRPASRASSLVHSCAVPF